MQVGVFEEALKLDPLNPELKLGLQRANEGLVKDLVEGERQSGSAASAVRSGFVVVGQCRRLAPGHCMSMFAAPGCQAQLASCELCGNVRSPHAVLRCAGRGRETRALEYPQPSQRISYHPYAAPLHKIKTDDMLPVRGGAALPFHECP